MCPKVALFDIDGTLIECSLGIFSITPSVKQAISAFQKNGNLALIATGRTKCFIEDHIKAYPFDGYITCNGAYVEVHDQCLYQKSISKEALEAVIKLCEKYDFIYFLEGKDKIYVRQKDDPRLIDFEQRWRMDPSIVEDQFDVEKIQCYIVMIQINDLQEEHIMKEALSPYFDISRHMLGQISYDLNIKGVNKGTGLKALVETLGEDYQETYAFGDGRNDLEMLTYAKYGIAMKEAAPELKAIADYVTNSVKEDGIVQALEYYHLI